MSDTTTDYAQIADQIKSLTEKNGFTIVDKGTDTTIFCLNKSFTPGSKMEFNQAETQAEEIMQLVKTTSPGSTWGTVTGTIGGVSAVNDGRFILNKSGVSKKLLKLLINTK